MNDVNYDYIHNAIYHVAHKHRVMESGKIMHDGHFWEYKIKWVKPKTKKEWDDVFNNRKEFFPDNTAHVPVKKSRSRCGLCTAPTYGHKDNCWNCGVKFV